MIARGCIPFFKVDKVDEDEFKNKVSIVFLFSDFEQNWDNFCFNNIGKISYFKILASEHSSNKFAQLPDRVQDSSMNQGLDITLARLMRLGKVFAFLRVKRGRAFFQ